MDRFSYYKVAAITPPVSIGDPHQNVDAMIDILHRLDSDTQLAVFPELAITGYTCQDLFYESLLLSEAKKELLRMAKEIPVNLACVVGVPLLIEGTLYNCAAFLFEQKILGIYVKSFIPGYNEYYEPRWFSSSDTLKCDHIVLGEQIVPLSAHIVFHDQTTNATIGIEICEDLWVSIPMSSDHALAGANILVNCSASNDIISKDEYRLSLIKHQSAACYAGYVYASAGVEESSSDLVFSGHDVIAENGRIIAQSTLYEPKDVIYGLIDLEHLQNDRLHFKTSLSRMPKQDYIHVQYASMPIQEVELIEKIDAFPFVPKDSAKRLERCQKILTIQAQGLATRLKKIHCENAIIGISGGLDSTLALLVTYRAFKLLGLNVKGIHAITMPGFGTSDRTKNNAMELMKELGVSIQTIPIQNAVLTHFKDIDHDESNHNITYENSQARYRTMLLMDLANKYNGIVIGTGDLSELALGWCTYNGDHMSMYAVNVSVPKTLVRYIVESEAIKAKKDGEVTLAAVLLDICDTPVSPELLPLDESGKIAQKTEEVLGSYDLHDFFLYHMLRYHESPKKIFALARSAFPSIETSVILEALRTFYRRFFTQQFNRNVMPDGVKVGTISFSPRGDWRMPSDASVRLWMREVEQL